MNEQQRARYARHIQLRDIGPEGQARLLGSRVLVVGLGGLGSPAVMYLAAAGVGHLVLSDYDRVELSNLQRQIIHATADIGRLKAQSAADTVARLNPEVRVSVKDWAMEDDELLEEVAAADAVVDASDNFATRFQLNAACHAARKPLISGAAARMEGQVSVFFPGQPPSPCYRCLFSDQGDEGEACALVGVFAPLLGVIGSLQAAETIKVLLGSPNTLAGRLLFIDAATMDWRTIRIPRDPGCPVCGPSTPRASA